MPQSTCSLKMNRCAWLVIIGFCVVRLIIAAILPAMIDEAYGIAVSRSWSLSYFDHPPICFSLARIMAWLVGSENIYLTTNHGKLIIINVSTGQPISLLKIDSDKISRPFVLNQNLYIIKENSIIRLN